MTALEDFFNTYGIPADRFEEAALAAGYVKSATTYTEAEEVPEDVTSLVDVDGDIWNKVVAWSCSAIGSRYSLSDMISNYGPMKRVMK